MKKFILLLSLVISFSITSRLYASHVMGADLTYECLGPNQYRVTLTGYRDCSGIDMSGPQSITVSSAACGVSRTLTLQQVGQPVDITPVCFSSSSSCHGGSGVGIEKYTFQGVLTLPAGCGNDWILGWSMCCRNAAITTLSNPSSDNFYIEARLDNTLPVCNNSPVFSNDPVGVYCNNFPQFFNHGAIDADGDSLYFYLTPSLEGRGQPVAYNSGYSGTNPIRTSTGTLINSANGQLAFTPSQTQIAVMKVAVDEFRNGVLIGHIERDMQLIVTNCNNSPPVSGGINGATSGAGQYTFNTTACSNFCFTIQTSDPNTADSIYARFVAPGLPGATCTSSGGKQPLLTICWAPTQNDVGSNTFIIALKDNACPYNATSSQAYTINVAAASNPPVNAGPDVTLCPGAGTTLTATSAGSVTSYVWGDGSTTHAGATWAVNPAVTTIYTVTATYANGCQLTDQVVVTRATAPTVTAFPATSTICSNADSIQLSAFANGATSYTWTPAAGLSCTSCANPKASPPATTTYSVVATSTSGCPSPPFNVTVNLSPPPPVQSCSVIYGTEHGTGNGSQANPASLATALSMAQCNNALIKLGYGTYMIDNPITNISSYTTIEGGFDPSTWVKSSTAGLTVIHRTTLNPEGVSNNKRLVAVYMNGSSYFRFQDITFETEDCPATPATDTFGMSNYVFHMTNCSNYKFVRCQIIPGRASDGSVGVSGTPGANGNAGLSASGSSRTGAAGGAAPNAGGAGGRGGGGGLFSGSSGNAGSPGAGGCAGGGSGGGGVTICSQNGVAGSNGSSGGNGTVGSNGSVGIIAGGLYYAGTRGANGGNGGNGCGGGGGGGNGGAGAFTDGSGGGGGGSGGQGGTGGTGGGSGGGSFGVFLNGNGSNTVFLQCNIGAPTPGAGGAGGAGSAGGTGGIGGQGGQGGSNCQNNNGDGGNGGNGGTGGSGGTGAPGICSRILLASGTPLTTGDSLFNLSAQPVISAQDISCTNRNDVLSAAASGSWTTGANATVPSGTGASITTQYTATGRKDIGYNGNIYSGFVNIALDQTSFIPVIQSSANVLNGDTFWVCRGSNANFNIQIASADSFQWNFGGATTPNTYYGANVQNLTGLSFPTAGTFLVQARIKTSCCGWSPWDTAYILVEPNATITYTGFTNFCPGDSVHVTLSGSGTSYSWAPTAGVSNPTGSDVYISPQVTTTYLATSYSPHGLCNADTSIPVTKSLPPTLSFTTVAAGCGPTGSALVTPSPAGTYVYQWNNTTGPNNGSSINNQPAGTYIVTVTPQGTSCSVSASTSIAPGAGVQAYMVKTVQPSCFGLCDGALKVKAIGGLAPFTYHWSTNPANIDSLNGLCAGTYTVTIVDANNCSSAATEVLTQPSRLLAVVLDSVSPKCPGQCTGYAFADGQGGTGPYQFAWSNGSLAQKDTLLCPGPYTLVIRDQHNCTATTSVNISNVLPMTVAFRTINDSCFGICNGSLKATVTNGQAPFYYTWSNNPAIHIDSIRNLCVGSYTVTVRDSFLCTVTATQSISEPAQVTATIGSQINDSCFGQCNGRLTATGGGGTPGYTYLWNNAGTTGRLDSNLCIGTYRVTVTDAMRCSASASATITQPTVLAITVTAKMNDSCSGQCNGRITTRATGGTRPYTYLWSNGAIDSVSTNLCVGRYTVTVRDAMGCTATVNDTVSEPTPLVLSLVSTTNVSCYGGRDGRIVVSAAGGSPGYLYGIDVPTPQPTGTFTGLAAGMHILGVYDSHGCYDTLHILLTEPPQLVADTISTKPESCNGANDGQIILRVSGGTPGYTYSWPGITPANTDSIADNLSANTYTAIVTDTKGCKDTVVAIVTQPAPLNATVRTDSVSCNGLSDGRVIITATGGTPSYTYQLDGAGAFQAVDSFIALAAGPHSVTVRDAGNCTKTVNFTIYQPVVLGLSVLTQRNASCNGICDGMVRLRATGGTLSYSFSKDGLVYNAVDSFTGLCAGTYTFTVQDHRGCMATVNATITEPVPLVLSLTSATDPLCYGAANGRIVVSAAGGTPAYLYAVDPFPIPSPTPIGTFNGLTAGLHVVGVADSHGCLDSLHILLGQPSQIIADTISTKPVSCFGGNDGAITLSVSGGSYPYSYAWPQVPGETDSISDALTANTYSAYVTDSRGCSDTVRATITQPTQLTGTVVVDSVKCFGACNGKVFVTPAGGVGPYQFQLDASGTYQAADSFTTLCAGSHTVLIQDANLCTRSVTFSVYQPAVLALAINTIRDASCNGQCNGMVRVTASGGSPRYSYSIDGFTYFLIDSFNNVCPGNYTVQVYDVKACLATIPVTVGEPPVLILSPVDSFAPSCYNSTNATFTVAGSGGTAGYQYSTDGGTTYQASGHFTAQTPGVKTVTVKDAHGCTATYTITVPNAQPNDRYTTTITPVTCNGGSDGAIAASIVGGGLYPPFTYTWAYDGSHGAGLTGIPAGTYTVLITDGNGCQVFGPADSVVPQPTPITDVVAVTPTLCYGSSDGCITVTPSGGTGPYTHSWSTGQSVNNPCGFAIGSYSDTIRDSRGCVHIESGIIMTQPTPVTAIATPTAITCPGDSNGTIHVAPSGGTPNYTYSWSPVSSNAQDISGLKIGTYTVIVTDAHNCTATTSASITAADPMVLHPQVKNVLCTPLKNGFIFLPITGGTPAYDYQWSNHSVSNYLPALDEGTYDVTITDANGCRIDTSFIITTDSSFIIRVTPDTATILQGESVILAADIIGGGRIATLTWDDASGLTCYDCLSPVATPVHTTQYNVHAVSDSGCISDASSLITVVPQRQLFVPNTFTPNGDGINDLWEIYGNKKTWIFVEVLVFDRWGEKVFESNDINFGWDGSYRGTMLEPNVYTYVLKVTHLDGYTAANKGTVTILR